MKWDHKNRYLKSWTRAEEKAAVAWAIHYGFDENFNELQLCRFMHYILLIRMVQGYDDLPGEGIDAVCILAARYARQGRNGYIFTDDERKAIKSKRLPTTSKRNRR